MDSDRFVAGFDYPMFVVTAVDDGTGARAGCLVGFATQSSIEPFRFLVCLSRRNRTFRVAEGASVLAVHVLGRDEGQLELAALFGERTGDDVDKFARCSWRPGPGGVPLLTDARRCLVGRILERVELGDHAGFLLEPIEVTADDESAPLSFRTLPDLEPGHQAG
ncbi:flavin reductase family protein [Actinomadura parmotrematis]|uniref:Flavin reductase family protein n=1 Tax=Actinomadura parmotrematis TaxID=2864039 RepID=A0ABS7G636_9ACTN|nr:flavin reductase family protein [Actinomadura parmotrematis]MBW8487344.1 flavin reductase family protein [Actinomadura parmotrematis]